jgi:hypothetical protein
MSGTKFDKGKPRISLVPSVAVTGCAAAMTFGADKYGAHNYKGGIEWSRLYDANQRHLLAILDGEMNDPESGLPHIDHALANLAMLKYMMVHKPELNDLIVEETSNDSETKELDIKPSKKFSSKTSTRQGGSGDSDI